MLQLLSERRSTHRDWGAAGEIPGGVNIYTTWCVGRGSGGGGRKWRHRQMDRACTWAQAGRAREGWILSPSYDPTLEAESWLPPGLLPS